LNIFTVNTMNKTFKYRPSRPSEQEERKFDPIRKILGLDRSVPMEGVLRELQRMREQAKRKHQWSDIPTT